MKLKDELLGYMRQNGTVSRDMLRQYGKACRKDVATTDRCLRKLTQEGLISPITGTHNFNVSYKLNTYATKTNQEKATSLLAEEGRPSTSRDGEDNLQQMFDMQW